MSTRQYPTAEYVRQLFTYDDGKLFWRERPLEHFKKECTHRIWNKKFSGKEAGTLHCEEKRGNKYYRWHITIDMKIYKRASLVWVFHHGYWQTGIDHEDRNSLNDRIDNLRAANGFQNAANSGKHSNNTSGFKAVSKYRNKWVSRMMINGVYKQIGTFDTPEEAYEAYCEKAKEIRGEFFHG